MIGGNTVLEEGLAQPRRLRTIRDSVTHKLSKKIAL